MHVVVTGASSGIGREIAKAFDGAGHRISLVARRLSLLEGLRSEMRSETRAIRADLADPADPIGRRRQVAGNVVGPILDLSCRVLDGQR
jgi:short-subunit dehydrogenase